MTTDELLRDAPPEINRGYSPTPEHLERLAHGRRSAKIVKEFLATLDDVKPIRGRKSKPVTQADLDHAAEAVKSAHGLDKLKAAQRRIDLEKRFNTSVVAPGELPGLSDFVKVAKEYGARKGLSYAAWREVGVPAAILSSAGIQPH